MESISIIPYISFGSIAIEVWIKSMRVYFDIIFIHNHNEKIGVIGITAIHFHRQIQFTWA